MDNASKLDCDVKDAKTVKRHGSLLCCQIRRGGEECTQIAY